MGPIVKRAAHGLPSIEKARELLTRCRTVQECLKIKTLAQAVASVEDGEAAKNEAAAIVLLAKARVGELTAAIPQAPHARGAGRGIWSVPSGNSPKKDRLEAEGLTRKEAAECEKISSLQKSGDLDRMIKRGATTTAAAVAMHRLQPDQRKQVLGKLGDNSDFRKAVGEVKLAAKRSLAEEIRANPVVTPDGRQRGVAEAIRR